MSTALSLTDQNPYMECIGQFTVADMTVYWAYEAEKCLIKVGMFIDNSGYVECTKEELASTLALCMWGDDFFGKELCKMHYENAEPLMGRLGKDFRCIP
jgi:hypothetical protein